MASTNISFDQIPASIRKPGKYFEFNTTNAVRTLAANLFGQRISKGPQCSNWSVMELSKRQVIYAATDAWIGRAIYLRMRELGMTGEAA